MTDQHQWQRITALHRQGHLKEAECCYRDILESDPNHAEATHMLGMLLHQLGKHGEAFDLLQRAIVLGKGHPALLSNTAKVYIELGDAETAMQLIERALRRDVDHFGSLYNQALAYRLQGKHADALNSINRAVIQKPGSAGALLLRASLLFELKSSGDSADAYRLALEHGANHAECMIGIAACRARQNNWRAALHALAGIEPSEIADTNLVFRAAQIHQQVGAWVDAVEWLNVVIEREPDWAEALLRRGVLSAQLGATRTAVEDYRRALSADSSYHQARSNLLIQLQYDARVPVAEIVEAHKDWAARHGSRAPRDPTSFPNSRDPVKPLVIGYISPRFDSGLISRFLPATLRAMPKGDFRFFFYNSRKSAADVPPSMAKLGTWRLVDGLGDRDLARLCADDGVDILVDLTGHNPGNRLTAISSRLAPIQVCWLDYFCTTGVPAVDYWLTDANLTPKGSERYFTERLLYLPKTRLCYAPPDVDIAPHRSLRAPGEIVFGSFNRLGKLTDEVIALWTEILNSEPRSRLLLKASEFRDQRVQAYTLDRFRRTGLAGDRIELRQPSPYEKMLAEYADIDVALDPFSFTGCATTCDALWMGVPVITLPGDSAVSRQGLSILSNIGQADWIANDAGDYRNKSLELASSLLAGGFDRAALRSRMQSSPLCDSAAQARALADILRSCWEKHCAATA